MKTAGVFVVLAAFAVFGVMASPSNEAASEPVTLQYMTWIRSSADNAEAFGAANPGINVDVEYLGGVADYQTPLRVRLASGDHPDVWDSSSGSFYTQRVEGGGAMDITDLYHDRGWDEYYSQGATDAVTRGGRIHGVVVGGVFPWQMIFVNVDVFERLGLEYPKTIDDMVELVPKLRADGIEPFGFVNADGWMGQIIFGDYMMQLVEHDTDEKLNSGELKWNEVAEMVDGFEAVKKLVDADAFMVGWQSGGIDDMRHAFLSQKVATMYVGTWWVLGDWGGPYDFEIDSIPLPLIDINQPPKAYQTYPDGIAVISPNTQHEQEAIDFLSSFVTDDFHRDILGSGGSLTTVPSVNEQLDLHPFIVNEHILNQFNYPLTNYWTTSFPVPVEEVLATQFDLIMAGKTTIEKALDLIEAEHKDYR
jgi:raffinose/stachyose/melibiose transport system substrate-binding protein